MLDHVRVLELAGFSYLYVYIVCAFYSTLAVTCVLVLPSRHQGPLGGQDRAFNFFCLPSISLERLFIIVTARKYAAVHTMAS